jgi:hypothetical protein
MQIAVGDFRFCRLLSLLLLFTSTSSGGKVAPLLLLLKFVISADLYLNN